ncbi:hypothetical protein Tco_0723165 [Tanacetum coccineum]
MTAQGHLRHSATHVLGYLPTSQPVLYDADTLLHPTHHPVSIWDSEEVLVHQVVSMKKMNEKPGHELSREQAYWLPANDIASKLVKPTFGASKTVPKRAPQNHSSLPAKSCEARRAKTP